MDPGDLNKYFHQIKFGTLYICWSGREIYFPHSPEYRFGLYEEILEINVLITALWGGTT